ncbi:rho guanine nucleotide exchange factor 28-like [Alosa alosa]|uniref:rho guanine nucleotide exchange factor 28-like n=1 Tax=Alosa alosa TaxID=278164 RepID=UPI0020154212|nr:rho guanine nucleotide exchange factor 28-like [Alosa alosa]
MLTENQHVQTLTVMAESLRWGLQEECQLGSDVIGQILPCVDKLLPLHQNFLCAMETRQRESTDPSNPKNFLIHRIGDILTEQFSGEHGAEITALYGEFCSKHTHAVNLYKQILQNNRKLQAFIKQQRRNGELKRREIPELLLLVTQRITKYPILLERLLQYTDEASGDACVCRQALRALRCVLSGVEQSVCERQKEQTFTHIMQRLDSRSVTRLRNGETFSKQQLTHTHSTHTHTQWTPHLQNQLWKA